MTDSEKLRELADWIDREPQLRTLDIRNEVADLRRIADEMEKIKANRYMVDHRPISEIREEERIMRESGRFS